MDEEEKYYVYVYLDPRKPGHYCYEDLNMCFLYEPIYVGKGHGKRYKCHVGNYELRTDKNKLKSNKLKKIITECEKPIIIKVVDKIKEQLALDIEVEYIKYIGRIKQNNGPLTNITDGGEGVSGLVHSEEILEKMRNRVISEETRKRISETLLGSESWSKGQTKETNKSLMQLSKTNKRNFAEGKYDKDWTEERRENMRQFHRKLWTGEGNPSKKNPRRGKSNWRSKWKYWLYENEMLIDEGFSLMTISENHNLNLNMLYKISRSGAKYFKIYTVVRKEHKE